MIGSPSTTQQPHPFPPCTGLLLCVCAVRKLRLNCTRSRPFKCPFVHPCMGFFFFPPVDTKQQVSGTIVQKGLAWLLDFSAPVNTG